MCVWWCPGPCREEQEQKGTPHLITTSARTHTHTHTHARLLQGLAINGVGGETAAVLAQHYACLRDLQRDAESGAVAGGAEEGQAHWHRRGCGWGWAQCALYVCVCVSVSVCGCLRAALHLLGGPAAGRGGR